MNAGVQCGGATGSLNRKCKLSELVNEVGLRRAIPRPGVEGEATREGGSTSAILRLTMHPVFLYFALTIPTCPSGMGGR